MFIDPRHYQRIRGFNQQRLRFRLFLLSLLCWLSVQIWWGNKPCLRLYYKRSCLQCNLGWERIPFLVASYKSSPHLSAIPLPPHEQKPLRFWVLGNRENSIWVLAQTNKAVMRSIKNEKSPKYRKVDHESMKEKVCFICVELDKLEYPIAKWSFWIPNCVVIQVLIDAIDLFFFMYVFGIYIRIALC